MNRTGEKRHAPKGVAPVLFGSTVALVHLGLTVGVWSQLDSGLAQHARWQWVAWTIGSFPLVPMVATATKEGFVVALGARSVDVFMATLAANSALWGILIAAVYGWMRSTTRAAS